MNIEKLIRADQLIIDCKKQAKTLKNSSSLSLMECQNLVAKHLGYFDWHTLYTSIKHKHNKEYNPVEFLVINSLINKNQYVHLEFRKSGNVAKFRNNWGELEEIDLSFTEDNLFKFISKYKPDLNVKELKEYVSAKFTYSNARDDIGSIRYQSLLVYPEGFDIVFKLQLFKIDYLSLSDLGFYPHQIDFLKSKRNGLILFSAPTGYGKETVINALIKEHQEPLRVVCISDGDHPMPNMGNHTYTEYNIFRTGYSQAINSCLRQKPDIIKLSSLRDSEQCKAVTDIGKTGHLILAPLNSGSSFGGLHRLQDFGLENVGNSNVTALVYLTKMHALCPHCKQKANAKNLEKFSFIKDLDSYSIYTKGQGCKHCTNGISGITICAEMVDFDDTAKDIIQDKGINGLILHWKNLNNGNYFSNSILGKTSKNIAIRKMLEGTISPDEIISRFGHKN